MGWEAKLLNKPTVDEITEQIQVAADWWTEQLKQVPEQDAGDPTINAVYNNERKQNALKPISDYQLRVFNAMVVHGLREQWEKQQALAVIEVGCDYGPDHILYPACREANISYPRMRLPIKSVVIVRPDSVVAKRGYGGEFETLWENVNGK